MNPKMSKEQAMKMAKGLMERAKKETDQKKKNQLMGMARGLKAKYS